MGSLGVRKSVDLALPAFFSSAHASQDLVTSILPLGEPGAEALSCEAADLWEERFSCQLPPVESRGRQHAWDSGPMETMNNKLYNYTNDPVAKARLLSVSTKEAGAWLNILPVPQAKSLTTQKNKNVVSMQPSPLHMLSFQSASKESVRREESRGQHPSSFRDWH